MVGINGAKKYFGCFEKEEDAARAYDKNVMQLGLDKELNFRNLFLFLLL